MMNDVQPAGKKGRVSRFFHTHNRLLTIIGASIVFMTFVIKEGLRDNLKDWIQSFLAAEDSYYVGTQIADIQIQLRRLELESGAIWRRLYLVKEKEIAEATRVGRIDVDLSRVNSVMTRLRTISAVASNLPFDLRFPVGKRTEASLKDLPDSMGLLSQLRTQRGTEMSAKLDEVEAVISKIERDLKEGDEELLAAERKTRSEYESMYDFLVEASFLLYALGWGLALAARIWGGGKLAGD